MQACQGNAAHFPPLVVLFCAILAGVTCDRRVSMSHLVWIAVAVIALGIWCLTSRWSKNQFQAGLVLIAAFCTAALWHHWHWRWFGEDELGLAANRKPVPICAEVIALSSPRRQPAPPPNPLDTMRVDDETHLPIRITRVRDGSQWRAASGTAMLRAADMQLDIHAGDRLRIFAHLSTPAEPLNPGEPEFLLYERSERRLCRLHVDSGECIRVIENGSRCNLMYWLNRVRNHCDRNLWRHISPSRAGLAAAVLLGTREQIDRDRHDDFMITGTVHLLSISGLHVAILVYGFWMIARFGWLSRKPTLILAVIFVGLYALLTDARPPVIRAAVLVAVMCAARYTGRQALSFNTLASAGIVVIALNPASFFQTGTQLSFLAVATMASIPRALAQSATMDPLERLVGETRPWPVRAFRRLGTQAWQAARLSTIIWLVALPLVMYRFHLLSPVATILNPIVCLPMAVALFAGFGVMVFGGVLPYVAELCGSICDASLWSMEQCIAWALAWRGNHCWLPAPPYWWVFVFYTVAAVWLAIPVLRPARSWCGAILLTWLAWGLWLTAGPVARAQPESSRTLTCTFVAVGHGTSVLMELPSGKTLLYDAGRLGTAEGGARSIASVLWTRGITHLDAIVVSHADADHFNAIPDLLRRFSVGVVYVSPVMFRRDAPALGPLRASIISSEIPIREISAGDRLDTHDQVRMTVLHPSASGTTGSDNANSIVVLVEFDGIRILLPGDLETPGLEELLERAPIDCDVIMAPHHGSIRSNPAGFARWSIPEHVIISGGIGRDARPVTEAYEAAGGRVYHTAEDGAVQIVVRDRRYRITTYRRPGKRPYAAN
jgi:competence protein ComEC